MRILLSAFACCPGYGSEPGLGWNWVVALNKRGYKLTVITNGSNRIHIENKTKLSPEINVRFIYCSLPFFNSCRKFKVTFYLYYYAWQIYIYFVARKLVKVNNFTLIHHVTFASFRMPSLLVFLPVFSVLGPLGGGEMSPNSLCNSLRGQDKIKERLRNIINKLERFNPINYAIYSKAGLILTTSSQTLHCIPHQYHSKCRVQLAIGVEIPTSVHVPVKHSNSDAETQKFRLLYAGRLLYWKGIHLVFEAIGLIRNELGPVEFQVVGKGYHEAWLRKKAISSGVFDLVNWTPAITQEKLFELFMRTDVLLFPSFHDSGGMVVLEAMAHGLPAICLDTGGPSQIVNEKSGCIVGVNGTELSIIAELSKKILLLSKDNSYRKELGKHAKLRSLVFSWDSLADTIYKKILPEFLKASSF